MDKKFVIPKWVYEPPKYDGAAMRITPLFGKFRDADWVEPDIYSDKSVSISARGGIRCPNSTNFKSFQNEYYVLWVINQESPPSLFRRFINSFNSKPEYKYWIPTTYFHE